MGVVVGGTDGQIEQAVGVLSADASAAMAPNRVGTYDAAGAAAPTMASALNLTYALGVRSSLAVGAHPNTDIEHIAGKNPWWEWGWVRVCAIAIAWGWDVVANATTDDAGRDDLP